MLPYTPICTGTTRIEAMERMIGSGKNPVRHVLRTADLTEKDFRNCLWEKKIHLLTALSHNDIDMYEKLPQTDLLEGYKRIPMILGRSSEEGTDRRANPVTGGRSLKYLARRRLQLLFNRLLYIPSWQIFESAPFAFILEMLISLPAQMSCCNKNHMLSSHLTINSR